MPLLGYQLRQHREQRGLSQEELAALVEPPLSPDTISNLERGRTRPHRYTLEALCRAMGLGDSARQDVWAAWRASWAATRTRGAAHDISVRHNLPLELTSFIGREQELADVQRRLATTRLLTLVGAGGIGKSRLALHAARKAQHEYADGVWLVELAPVQHPPLVPSTVAAALGIRERAGRSLLEMLADALRTRRTLLILDNCEHLIDPCTDLIQALLRSSPGLQVLATSRERLGSEGEAVWRVPSLGLPIASADTEPPRQSPAVRLFVERARAAQPDFALTEHNAAAVVEVCRRLDGIPLALELAAARITLLTPEQIMVRLDDRLRLLTSGSRTAPPRHQTLRATLEWSYGLLADRERQLFARLSVFAGGWSLEACEAVCSSDDLASGEIMSVLGRLVDKSLVLAEPSPAGSVRFRMLETLREYALELLVQRGEAGPIRWRHAAFFLELADRLKQQQRNSGVWLEQLERERDNLRSALHWAEQNREVETGLRLAVALEGFWERHIGEGRQWLEGLLRGPGSDNATTGTRAWALNVAGLLAQHQGDHTRAKALHQEQLGLFGAVADMRGIAATLHNLSLVAQLRGEYEQATALGEHALSLWRQLGRALGVATTLNVLGEVARHQGDPGRAALLHEESLAMFAEMGDKQGTTYALINLGELARHRGDFERVAALCEQSLALQKELGDTRGMAFSLSALGEVAAHAGNHRQAWQLCQQAVAMFWELGDKWGLAEALERLAGVAAFDGQHERAARLFGSAEMLRERIGTPLAPPDRIACDRSIAVARGGLAPGRFCTSWSVGRAMPLEQVITYVLSVKPEVLTIGPGEPSRHHVPGPLSRREQQVAALVARGFTNRQIAEALVITERTAETHLERIYTKLDVHSRAQLATWMAEAGRAGTR